MRSSTQVFALLAGAAAGCGSSPAATPPMTVPVNVTPHDDTFISGRNPDNSNGASASIFVGVDGQGGSMRGLLQFAMPAALQGATVTGVKLALTSRALGQGGAGPDVMLRLEALVEPWTQGNGVGDTAMTYTVGELCSDTVSGATWDRPACAGGTGPAWLVPGGTVAATVSGQADTTGVALESAVVWDAAAAGNAGLIADVQGWIDTPSGNHGWRIASSDETTFAAAKRFYSSEAGGNTVPTLTITYSLR